MVLATFGEPIFKETKDKDKKEEVLVANLSC